MVFPQNGRKRGLPPPPRSEDVSIMTLGVGPNRRVSTLTGRKDLQKSLNIEAYRPFSRLCRILRRRRTSKPAVVVAIGEESVSSVPGQVVRQRSDCFKKLR